MEKWLEKMKQGDVREAARRANVSDTNFRNARAKGFKNMSSSELKIMYALKSVIEDREKMLAEINGI